MINKIFLIFILTWAGASVVSAQNSEMAQVKGGTYIPLYGTDSTRVHVKDFLMDTIPVTIAEYKKFLEVEEDWRRSKIKKLFADDNYLKTWNDDLDPGELKDNEPVTHVSWFSARDYCRYQGKRLPTVDEWEYVAMADQRETDAREKTSYNQYILNWYEKPKVKGQEVGNTFKNYWGIYDLHGLIWEWTQDFNSVMIASESRTGGNDPNLFCSAAAVGATDLMNYAAFMRYAFRASVKGRYTSNNMGFRCAKDIN